MRRRYRTAYFEGSLISTQFTQCLEIRSPPPPLTLQLPPTFGHFGCLFLIGAFWAASHTCLCAYFRVLVLFKYVQLTYICSCITSYATSVVDSDSQDNVVWEYMECKRSEIDICCAHGCLDDPDIFRLISSSSFATARRSPYMLRKSRTTLWVYISLSLPQQGFLEFSDGILHLEIFQFRSDLMPTFDLCRYGECLRQIFLLVHPKPIWISYSPPPPIFRRLDASYFKLKNNCNKNQSCWLLYPYFFSCLLEHMSLGLVIDVASPNPSLSNPERSLPSSILLLQPRNQRKRCKLRQNSFLRVFANERQYLLIGKTLDIRKFGHKLLKLPL